MADWDAPTTFAQVWASAVASRPTETFLIFEGPDGHVAEWTYAEFEHQVERVAALLHREAVGPGSAVHLALTNCPTFVAVWIATIRLGAWIVPGDPMGKEQEFADQIERTDPTVGFYAEPRSQNYGGAVPAGMTAIARSLRYTQAVVCACQGKIGPW